MTIIVAQGGRGGRGSATKRNPRHHTNFIASGGKGGRGGDVLVVTKSELPPTNTSFQSFYSAPSGQNGSKNNRSGKDGTNLLLEFPCNSSILIDGKEVLATKPIIVAQGGRGGRGARTRHQILSCGGKEGQKTIITLALRVPFLAKAIWHQSFIRSEAKSVAPKRYSTMPQPPIVSSILNNHSDWEWKRCGQFGKDRIEPSSHNCTMLVVANTLNNGIHYLRSTKSTRKLVFNATKKCVAIVIILNTKLSLAIERKTKRWFGRILLVREGRHEVVDNFLEPFLQPQRTFNH